MQQAKIARAGKEIGVYDLKDIPTMVEQGVILPDDHYWHDGLSGWKLVQVEIDRQARETRNKIIKITSAILGLIALFIGASIVISDIKEKNRIKEEAQRAAEAIRQQELKVAQEKANLARIQNDDHTIKVYLESKKYLESALNSSFTSIFDKYGTGKTYFHNIFKGEYSQPTINRSRLTDSRAEAKYSPAIIFFVTDKGTIELHSSYYGEKWIFHVAIESRNENGFFRTPPANANNIKRKVDDGDVEEKLAFNSQESLKFLRSLCSLKNGTPRLSFLDKDGQEVGFGLQMNDAYWKAAKESLLLADAFKGVTELKELALEALQRRASEGHAPSQYNLFLLTDGSPSSLEWLKKSAENNYRPAALHYAERIAQSNPSLAATLRSRFADKGPSEKSPGDSK